MPAAYSSDGFVQTLLRLQNSPTYGLFCEKVYGRNLCQFNALDEEQLQALVSALNLNSTHSVLDLGCGGGFISEYISDKTGASVTGVDFAKEVIELAQQRTSSKRQRLNFIVGNLNALSDEIGKFDIILSIDTLYFVEDLSASIRSFKKLLTLDGRIAAFYTYKRKPGDIENALKPESNKLGKALTAAGFRFETHDYSSNEQQIWTTAKNVAEELKELFTAEGNIKTYQGRVSESEENLNSILEGRSARSFYLTEKNGKAAKHDDK